jgi:hypothetical protein
VRRGCVDHLPCPRARATPLASAPSIPFFALAQQAHALAQPGAPVGRGGSPVPAGSPFGMPGPSATLPPHTLSSSSPFGGAGAPRPSPLGLIRAQQQSLFGGEPVLSPSAGDFADSDDDLYGASSARRGGSRPASAATGRKSASPGPHLALRPELSQPLPSYVVGRAIALFD